MRWKYTRKIARYIWLAAGSTLTLSCLLTLPAVAEDAPSPQGDEVSEESVQQNTPAAAAGLTVFIDPETGAITDQPSAEQRAALNEAVKSLHSSLSSALSKSTEGLVAFELRHGGHGVYLDGRFQSALILRPRADGSFALGCADHPDEVVEMLATPAPPAATEWVER